MGLGQPAYGYSAPVSALEYNEGSVDLLIAAGMLAGDPVVVQMRPDGQRPAGSRTSS